MANSSSITFDLDPEQTKQGPQQSTSLIGPNDAPWAQSGADDLSGFSDDQISKLDDWVTANQAAMRTYTDDMVKLVDEGIQSWQEFWALPENVKLLNEAYNVRTTLLKITDANGNLLPGLDAPVSTFYGGVTFYGPLQEYWFEWDFQSPVKGVSVVMPAAPRYVMVYIPAYGDAQLEYNNPPTLASGQTLANGGTPMTYAEFYAWAAQYGKTDAVTTQQNQYDAIYQNLPPPPTPAPLPAVTGSDISIFDYSPINIFGDTWEYDQ